VAVRDAAPWRHPYFRHLRLGFNLLLTPIYLWGALLAGGELWSGAFWLGYFALHVFLYGGTTAFNSYYDRDDGPIGGMLEPPAVDRGLLIFSLAWQGLGLLLALLVNPPFAFAYLVLFLVAAAYSHPLTRFKASPAAALLAVALGQGAVGFAAGWLVFRPSGGALLEADALVGMLTTALVVTGLYVVTQSYQTSADRARGDLTLPVLWGARRALMAAVGVLAAGGGFLMVTMGARFGSGWAAALFAFFAVIGVWLVFWAKTFDEGRVKENFRTAMRLTAISSLGLSFFLLYHLV
jgi:4-hydroxybenzoate polyprenyltransferase